MTREPSRVPGAGPASSALFVDDGARRPSTAARRSIGWIALVAAVVAATVLTLLPSPYVIRQPGPVFDTLGTTGEGADVTDLIAITGQQTYPTEGTLDMLTVSVYGNPDVRPNWIEIAGAWVDPERAVVPLAEVYPADVSTEEVDEQSLVQMSTSQQIAIAAALRELDYPVTTSVGVAQVTGGAPADGVLEAGDVVTAIDGVAVQDEAALRAAIEARAPGDVIRFDVLRGGTAETVEVTAGDIEGRTAIGVLPAERYTFPFQVDIELHDVGGPSAGMMFALAIIDKLTPGAITGGQDVAGTGTITAAGDVGPIGGIEQKMYGARDAGAEWFLAPVENCDEVTGAIPSGIEVFSVDTLDDAITALGVLAEGGDTSALPTCPAG